MKIIRFALAFVDSGTKFGLYLFLQTLSSLLLLAFPYVTGGLIDVIVYSQDRRRLFQYCAIIAAVSMLRLTLSYCSNTLYASLFVASSYKMSSHVIRHIHEAPLLQTGKLDPAYLNQRISQDAGALIGFAVSMVAGYTAKVIESLVAFLVVYAISPPVALIAVASLGLYFITYTVLKTPLHKKSLRVKEEQAVYFAKMYEQIHRVKFVKAHTLSVFFRDRLRDSFTRFQTAYLGWYRLSYLFSGLDGTVTTISQTLLYTLGGYAVMRGVITIGAFTIVSNYFSKLIGAESFFFASSGHYQETLVSYQRIADILAWEPETTGMIVPKTIRAIQLSGVCFSYGNREVLRNVSLELHSGNVYAFTGKNGAGKSTLAQLMIGLFPRSYQGTITVDGVPMEELNLRETRAKLIGYVEQDAPMLADDIARNVFLGKEAADAVMEGVQKLRLLDFVAAQPSGWATVIHPQNDSLSGGERQRVSIARALLKDPDLLIFDEPTSALDSQTSTALLSYLASVKKDKIIVLITHDKRAIEICDEVIAIES